MFFESSECCIFFYTFYRFYLHISSLLSALIVDQAYLTAYLLILAGTKLQIHDLGNLLDIDDLVVDLHLEVL